MRQRYDIAPEFRFLPRISVPANRLLLRLLNRGLRIHRMRFSWSDEVVVRTRQLEQDDGRLPAVIEIAPRNLNGPAPAVIDYHGGGFFLTYFISHLRMAQRYALEGGCRVFFPDYRLSTHHPFPAGFDDCYATLAWVHRNAAELEVDPDRIVLLGDSAGGALAAGVAQKALDRGENPICGQILIYPVADHETKTESALEFRSTAMWRTASNRTMWKLYLRETEYATTGKQAPMPPYAAPLHRANFAGLPPAFIEVAEFDPLRDEGRQYAAALEAAGVATELLEAKRAVHAYDVVSNSPIAEKMQASRLAALRRFFELT